MNDDQDEFWGKEMKEDGRERWETYTANLAMV